jgi:hypothetical protein
VPSSCRADSARGRFAAFAKPVAIAATHPAASAADDACVRRAPRPRPGAAPAARRRRTIRREQRRRPRAERQDRAFAEGLRNRRPRLRRAPRGSRIRGGRRDARTSSSVAAFASADRQTSAETPVSQNATRPSRPTRPRPRAATDDGVATRLPPAPAAAAAASGAEPGDSDATFMYGC